MNVQIKVLYTDISILLHIYYNNLQCKHSRSIV